MEDYDSKKWYNVRGLVFLFLIILWPLGLIGLYLSKSLTKFQKFLYVLGAFIFVAFFINVLVPSIQSLRHDPESNVKLPEDPRPGDQITFEETYKSIRMEYENSEGNEFLRQEQADKAKTFLSVKRVVDNWKGSVQQIYSSGTIVVSMFSYQSRSNSSKSSPIMGWQGKFYLVYDDMNFIRTLKVGDNISFSGQFEDEESWTDSGAMDEPEIRIKVNHCEAFDL
jgi:hypothetical protein